MSKQVSLPERTEERGLRTCLPQPNDSLVGDRPSSDTHFLPGLARGP